MHLPRFPFRKIFTKIFRSQSRTHPKDTPSLPIFPNPLPLSISQVDYKCHCACHCTSPPAVVHPTKLAVGRRLARDESFRISMSEMAGTEGADNKRVSSDVCQYPVDHDTERAQRGDEGDEYFTLSSLTGSFRDYNPPLSPVPGILKRCSPRGDEQDHGNMIESSEGSFITYGSQPTSPARRRSPRRVPQDEEYEGDVSDLENLNISFRSHLTSCTTLTLRIKNSRDEFEAMERRIEDEENGVVPRNSDVDDADWNPFSTWSDVPSLTSSRMDRRMEWRRGYTSTWMDVLWGYGWGRDLTGPLSSSAREIRSTSSLDSTIPTTITGIHPSPPLFVEKRRRLQKARLLPRAPRSKTGKRCCIPRFLHRKKFPFHFRSRSRASWSRRRCCLRRGKKEKDETTPRLRHVGPGRILRRSFSFSSGATERARGEMRDNELRRRFSFMSGETKRAREEMSNLRVAGGRLGRFSWEEGLTERAWSGMGGRREECLGEDLLHWSAVREDVPEEVGEDEVDLSNGVTGEEKPREQLGRGRFDCGQHSDAAEQEDDRVNNAEETLRPVYLIYSKEKDDDEDMDDGDDLESIESEDLTYQIGIATTVTIQTVVGPLRVVG